MKVSLADVAKECGVSLSTVSGVMGARREMFSRATREAVMDAANRLGYVPNASARSIRSGKFHAIGLASSLDSGVSTLPEFLVMGIEAALSERRYRLTMVRQQNSALADEKILLNLLGDVCCDALLVNYTHGLPTDLESSLLAFPLPKIWINNLRPTDAIRPDDRDALRQATTLLVRRGHRNIGCFYNRENKHFCMPERLSGYREAMQEAGLAPMEYEADATCSSEQRLRFVHNVLSETHPPTAAVTFSPRFAYPVLYAAALLGLRVPQDLSVITVADNGPADGVGVKIDTMAIPQYQIGKLAVDLLFRKIAAPHVPLEARQIPMIYESGSTLAAARD